MGLYKSRQIFKNDSFQYVIEVDFQLNSFYEYIELTEKIIENGIKEKIEAYDKLLKEGSVEEIEHQHDFVDHEIKIYTRQLYYHSLFISLYSFLERKMYQLCRIPESQQNIKTKDISGEGVIKYRTYLQKVLMLDFTKLNEEWENIKKYNKLRNRLVHSPTNMIAKGNDQKLISTFQAIENLTIYDKGDYIEFEIADKQLLIKFCKIISSFLKGIYYERA